MTTGFDLDEIERLMAVATPEDEWFVVRYGDGDALVICRDEAGNQRIAFMAVPGSRDHLARNRTWKAIKANAALIVALHNSAAAMLTEIRELRAENARLRVECEFIASATASPLVNPLETGFRHSPLSPRERETRYMEACALAYQSACVALTGEPQ